MPQPMTAGRVRVALAQMLYRQGIELSAIYQALGIDPADADQEALAHLAGIMDGMEAAAKAIRAQGLEGWSQDR